MRAVIYKRYTAFCFKLSRKHPLTGFHASVSVLCAGAPMDRWGWARRGLRLSQPSTYSELRGLMKESFKRSKPDWLVLLLRRGHLWQELLLQRQ